MSSTGTTTTGTKEFDLLLFASLKAKECATVFLTRHDELAFAEYLDMVDHWAIYVRSKSND